MLVHYFVVKLIELGDRLFLADNNLFEIDIIVAEPYIDLLKSYSRRFDYGEDELMQLVDVRTK